LFVLEFPLLRDSLLFHGSNTIFLRPHHVFLTTYSPVALLLTVFDSRITQMKLKHLHNLVFTCVTLRMSILSLFFGDNKTRCIFSL
jgi:hypothetical protein